MSKRSILLLFFLFILLLPAKASSKVIFAGDMDNVYLQIMPAPKGRLVSSIAGHGVLAKTNGTFFQVYRGTYYPIGQVISWGKKTPSIPGPEGQWWIIQEMRLKISKNPPKNPKLCICAFRGAPILIKNGKIVVSTRGLRRNAKRFLRRNCIRNILALTKKGKLRIYRSQGSLFKIANHLAKQGVTDAVNLDGGRSTKKTQPVANVIMVCKKTRPCYDQFKKRHFCPLENNDWLISSQKNLQY